MGPGVSDVQAISTNADGHLDLVITDKLTGQVSVLYNDGDDRFAGLVPYRAGMGFSDIDPGSTPEVTSLEATAGVAAGPLTLGGPTDLVTINPGSNTLDVLASLGGGWFANPVTLQTASPAQIVRMGDFTGNGIDDLAVLTAKGLSIYLGDGRGGFLPPTTYAVPSEADGLTLADVNNDGQLDLLVGDAYGDVLILLGNGNGTFAALSRGQPGRRAGRRRPHRQRLQGHHLRRSGVRSRGRRLWGRRFDRTRRPIHRPAGARSRPVGRPQRARLSADLIVANSGSNNVLIYPGLGNGQFGPAINGGHGYFVGTNPVGITVANVSHRKLPDGKPDPRLDLVVADQDSNQVSILLNDSQGNAIAFEPGERLNSGGSGPVSTVVGDFTGNGLPDILVTNSGSNNVVFLPGIGSNQTATGFFNDQSSTPVKAGTALGQTPVSFPVGNDPVTSLVGSFDGQTDLVTVNAGSNDLTLVSGFEGPDRTTSTIGSGGIDPDTAFAFASGSGFEDLVVGNSGDGVLSLVRRGDQPAWV